MLAVVGGAGRVLVMGISRGYCTVFVIVSRFAYDDGSVEAVLGDVEGYKPVSSFESYKCGMSWRQAHHGP